MASKLQDIGKIDNWIERLMRCEYLSEAEVQELCIKVRTFVTNTNFFEIASILSPPFTACIVARFNHFVWLYALLCTLLSSFADITPRLAYHRVGQDIAACSSQPHLKSRKRVEDRALRRAWRLEERQCMFDQRT